MEPDSELVGDQLPHAAIASSLGEHRFAPNVLPETKAGFASELSSAEPAYVAALRHAVASAPRISAADDAVLSKDPGYNADIRTTCVTTMLKAAPQDNVLPTTAEATVNCRILPGETRAQVRAALEKAIGDPNVTVSEWPENGDNWLPQARVTVTLSHVDPTHRRVLIADADDPRL